MMLMSMPGSITAELIAFWTDALGSSPAPGFSTELGDVPESNRTETGQRLQLWPCPPQHTRGHSVRVGSFVLWVVARGLEAVTQLWQEAGPGWVSGRSALLPAHITPFAEKPPALCIRTLQAARPESCLEHAPSKEKRQPFLRRGWRWGHYSLSVWGTGLQVPAVNGQDALCVDSTLCEDPSTSNKKHLPYLGEY
ncbi:hypothetical protein MG293_020431 [Ovis ammon polii]|uniref:Uncharacterized protein n=1 Tax=Ovis ammon polii TaxID=230172 RepID=A0AAD4Y035_OVIAM|nr:hypothetical protein MG293_020431 [Ovis ammon polii]